METELQATIVDNIRRTYDQAQVLAQSAADKGREAILKARECGQFLIEARENVPGKKLKPWLVSHVTFISYETAQRWVRLAETPIEDLEKALSLRQAYIAAGILPESHREESQNPVVGEPCKWMSLIQKAQAELDGLKDKIFDWAPTERLSLKERLRPMVELYAKL